MANPPTFGAAGPDWLGRVNVLGGQGDHPCYRATLRAALRPASVNTSEVVKKTVGLRSLAMSTVEESVGIDPGGSLPLHAPLLLRLHAGAYKGNNANVLEIGGMRGSLLPAVRHDYADLLVTPASAAWPDQDDPDVLPGDWDPAPGEQNAEISAPAFRLQGGAATLLLKLGNDALTRFLQASQASLLGGLVPVTTGAKEMPVTLVAEGVEFDGALPDPTRVYGGASDTRIVGRFRLEYDPRRRGGGYYLRLVGHADGGRAAMDALEARIGAAFTDLAQEDGSPLAISLDRRPVVPPLLWPLERKSDVLSLIPSAGAAGDFDMEIDRAAATVRLRTRSDHMGEAAGLATVLAERIGWSRTAAGFDLRIGAGALGTDQLSLAFAKDPKGAWTTAFTVAAALPVTVPLYEHGQRMADLYRQSRAAAPGERQAPYLYFPLVDGWLQLALPRERKETPPPSASATRSSSVMAGKIVAGTGRGRAVRILDAAGLSLTMHWDGTAGLPRARRGLLQVSGAQAVFQGFLYAAETSPTAAEALPDLRRGPAATREMPIHLGAAAQRLELSGTFGWDADHNTWKLDVDQLRGTNLDTAPGAVRNNVAWLPVAGKPFISNHPLTRSVPSAREPSLSRGLLPFRFGQSFSLRVASGEALPLLSPRGPLAWEGLFASRAAAFRDDTLLLPTLAGVEFFPTAPAGGGPIEAALRFDLPLLDELFAWSDPPREKPPASETPAPEALAVTTLDMARMQEVWAANRSRMALARTQAAFATPWQAVGVEQDIVLEGLVEPYAWPTRFGVDLAASPYGQYTLGGATYTPRRAVAGLDGVSFRLQGARLEADNGGAIRVAGFAASLFASGADRIWDSRGFGMAPVASAAGRPASQRSLTADQPPAPVQRDFVLFTMPEALTLPRDSLASTGKGEFRFATDLQFYVRDLALTDRVFDGAGNPVESGAGTTGQAFLPAALPGALHEWRFLETPGTDGVQRHDIACGPFRFKPLRLLRAEFDAHQAVHSLRIVGSMRLDLDPALSLDGSTPFGPDEVYRGGDLFELSLTRSATAGAWECTWKAVAAEPAPGSGLVRFRERAGNGIRCAVLLTQAPGGIRSKESVPATVEFDLLGGAAILEARLFGSAATLRCPHYTVAASGITLAFPATAPAAHVPRTDGVWLVDMAPTVSIARSESTLRIDGALVAMAAAATPPAAGAALAVFGSDTWRWLDLAPGNDIALEPPTLTVDHRTGVLSGRWNARGNGKPLFGLEHIGLVAHGQMEAVAAGIPITASHAPIPMGSAWMRVSSAAARPGEAPAVLDHRLRLDPGGSEHTLDLSGTMLVHSPIHWPLDGLRKDSAEGAALDLAADPWFDPGQGEAPLRPLSRVLCIRDDARVARHRVTLRLNRHRISAAQLDLAGGIVSVREPVRLLAVAEHTLTHDTRQATWTSLDYVTITTAAAMRAATSIPERKRWYYFAPRYRFGAYRTKRDDATIVRPGMAPLRQALAGFHDPLMIAKLWEALPQHTPVLLGGAALQLRLGDGKRSLVAVMPWMRLPDAQLTLTQTGGTWHVPVAELWSGHALESMEATAAVGLSAQTAAPALAERFAAAGLAGPVPGKPMADVLAVEQAWFEKWRGAAAAPMDDGDLGHAPFFLRSLLVIARRWQQDDALPAQAAPYRWDAASLLPCRTDANRKIPNKEGPALVRIDIRDSAPWQQPYREPVTLVPADLTVLSRTRASFLPSYRLVAQAPVSGPDETAPRAVLVAQALDADRAALVAVQEATAADGMPAVAPVVLPTRLDDWLARPGSEIRHMPELLPSAALGWPSGTGLRALERMGPRLGDELPVLSPASGFSGRFQRFGWPAMAVRAGMQDAVNGGIPAPEAFYLSFANRIAYERATQLDFNGPPARHLMPAPVRRRAPLGTSMSGTLETLAGGAGRVEPLLLPGIERATIGRRPGVFEVAVASLTVPGDSGAFDRDHARFGRPGNSGPVVVHQLRTPRSPLLPGDADDDAIARESGEPPLAFRRRTYLSEADRDGQKHLVLFKTFGGNVDVMRIGKGKDQVRVAVRLAGSDLIGPTWGGEIAVAFDARNDEGKEGGNDIARLKLEGKARLEIGERTFALNAAGAVAPAAFSWQCAQLADARQLLRACTADTPIRLVFGVLPVAESGSTGQLADAAVTYCTIRLALDPGIRSVLPVGVTTLAFGDPSYDRQLASPTRNKVHDIEDKNGVRQRIVLSADRKQYDTGSTLYFAFGRTDRESGLFAAPMDELAPVLRITRARAGAKLDDPPVTVPLALRDAAPDAPPEHYRLEQGRAYAIPLSQLHAPDERGDSLDLAPDDRLTLSVMYRDEDALEIMVDIVGEPAIAPAPCVYSALGTDTRRKRMSVLLHAAGPLPQRIEFDDLKRDLALGQVRRRALFIWRWAGVGAAETTVELVKLDRSGGTQLPPGTP